MQVRGTLPPQKIVKGGNSLKKMRTTAMTPRDPPDGHYTKNISLTLKCLRVEEALEAERGACWFGHLSL